MLNHCALRKVKPQARKRCVSSCARNIIRHRELLKVFRPAHMLFSIQCVVFDAIYRVRFPQKLSCCLGSFSTMNSMDSGAIGHSPSALWPCAGRRDRGHRIRSGLAQMMSVVDGEPTPISSTSNSNDLPPIHSEKHGIFLFLCSARKVTKISDVLRLWVV